jgi:hypothetical protein
MMSFVTTLTTDTGTIEYPSWEEIEKAISALDGKNLTLVMLAPAAPKGPPSGDHHMAIGGGKDGRCVIYITEDNLHFWNLEDASKRGIKRRIEMIVGGQEGDYDEAQCVSREWALKAARAYFERGAPAGDLPWMRS